MRLTVDHATSNEYPDNLTVQGLLDYLDVEAVAWLVISINGYFIKRDKFKEFRLNEDDEVELVYIRGGG